MDERLRGRRGIAESMYVCHNVVTESLLVIGNRVEVDLVEVRAHLPNRVIRNLNAQLALRFGEGQPETAPQAVARCRGPQLEHRSGGVSLGQRRAIDAGHCRLNSVA